MEVTAAITVGLGDGSIWGTSLVVQWVRICLPVQGTRVLIWCRQIPHVGGNSAQVPKLLKPVCPLPVLSNGRSHCSEEPAQSSEDLAQPERKKERWFLKRCIFITNVSSPQIPHQLLTRILFNRPTEFSLGTVPDWVILTWDFSHDSSKWLLKRWSSQGPSRLDTQEGAPAGLAVSAAAG